jgi:hypothetical protein
MPDLLSNSDEFQRFVWHFAAFRAGFRKNAELGKSHNYLCNKVISAQGVDFEYLKTPIALLTDPISARQRGRHPMTQPIRLIVMGMIALDDNDAVEIPEDLDELSAYELALRLQIGRPVADRTLICVSSRQELLELIEGIEGLDIALDLTTDDRNQPAPANLDDLMALLPGDDDGGGDPGTAGGGDPLFNIL